MIVGFDWWRSRTALSAYDPLRGPVLLKRYPGHVPHRRLKRFLARLVDAPQRIELAELLVGYLLRPLRFLRGGFRSRRPASVRWTQPVPATSHVTRPA
jgi:hypothetical protein